jgi:hypothetical protein
VLTKIKDGYPRGSQFTRTCRQLQVALTRVPIGGKTTVIEMSTQVFYKKINAYAMLGMKCKSFCSLYSLQDLISGEVSSIVQKCKEAIKNRGRVCIEVKNSLPEFETCSLSFPSDRLVRPMIKGKPLEPVDFLNVWICDLYSITLWKNSLEVSES